MKDVGCPYCEHEFDIDQCDGHCCEDGEVYEETCPKCDKIFQVVSSISWSFDSYATECLNDGNHDFQPKKYPHPQLDMGVTVCTVCGKEQVDKELKDEGWRLYVQMVDEERAKRAEKSGESLTKIINRNM